MHSGDASLLLPAQRLFVETHRRVKRISQKLCKALRISGPFNIQFLGPDHGMPQARRRTIMNGLPDGFGAMRSPAVIPHNLAQTCPGSFARTMR